MRRVQAAWLVGPLCGAVLAGCAVGVGYTVPVSGGSEPVDPPSAPPAPAAEPESGAETEDEVAGVIVAGRSTTHDVVALLGPPTTYHRDENGNAVWTYWSNETAGGAYAHQAVRVVFDRRGIVSRVDSHRAAP
ncbi:MAG: outer membrane protein assembly factor BamE domain-containing protein [Myxococcota bacterium]